MTWQCGPAIIDLSTPAIMGILNVTPDSFSDGGLYVRAEDALAHGRQMRAEGARIIDVGGESSRPGSEETGEATELGRVLPVAEALAAEGAVVSVDTRHAAVASAAVAAGAAVINDISGFRSDEMLDVAAGCDAGLVVMHMQGEPGTMQEAPAYGDVVAEVGAYLVERARALESAGVDRARIAIDPGIGFGKTTQHNLDLLRRLDEIAIFGYPVVVGVSRKRFIGEITGVAEPRERLAGSLAAGLLAVANGAAVLRVHDVGETAQALRMSSAIAGRCP
jgi:dihydropteroate synthase